MNRMTVGPRSTVKLLAGDNPQVAKSDGDAAVEAYISAIPGWKQTVARRLDELIVQHAPQVSKGVRWNSAMYGIKGQGWFASFHVFSSYVKLTFFKGTALQPAPGGGTAKEARWVNVTATTLDETQIASWVKQAAAIPGWGRQ
ncbi:MAG: DUF1801 domain-containing protein [Candidatus Accumulibacter sp.]|nr:DUF1801 domain-containing protein [Accumulibacter sp.]